MNVYNEYYCITISSLYNDFKWFNVYFFFYPKLNDPIIGFCSTEFNIISSNSTLLICIGTTHN